MWAQLEAMLAHLGAMLTHLGAMLAHLGAMLAHVGAMLAHLEAYVGPCWPILSHKLRKIAKNGKSTKHCKTRGFLAVPGCTRWVGGRGRGPSLLRRGENCRTARTRPGGPWPDLSAYARQPARGPTMLAHLVAICWPHVDPYGAKRSEKWEQEKNAVKRRIFWWSVAYLGAMLAHLGAMLAYLEGNVGPSWGYVGPSWRYRGPSWGLCCPMLGLCWSILRPMLAHVDPSWATKAEKWEKWEEHETP